MNRFPRLRCLPCGMNEDHHMCYSDGNCRCGCEFNRLFEVAEAKLEMVISGGND